MAGDTGLLFLSDPFHLDLVHVQSVHGCLCGRMQTHVEVRIYMCAFPCAQGKEGEGESELLLTGGQNMKPKQK